MPLRMWTLRVCWRAMEELREVEWAANQMNVDDEEYERPWPMEVDG